MERFLSMVASSFRDGTLIKLTLGKCAPSAREVELRNLFVRPVTLKSGPRLSLVYRYKTRDVTKNFTPETASSVVRGLLGTEFLDAHLFTPMQTVQLEIANDGRVHLRQKVATHAPASHGDSHDREKVRLIAADVPWMTALGITTDQGRPREGMAAKLRQIHRFTEVMRHLLLEAGLITAPDDDPTSAEPAPFTLVDMGCGKGDLTFAMASLLRNRARVFGVEARKELVTLCEDVARRTGLSTLSFVQGEIATATWPAGCHLDVLVALHACDTATDDALARGIAAGARLLVVSPCCQKELRPHLQAPRIMEDAFRHGIFRERQAEFVTDALRAQLLEWAGYRTRVFEFVSTEHTARNLMIAAIKEHAPGREDRLRRLREFAAFFGVRSHALARHLNLDLADGPAP